MRRHKLAVCLMAWTLVIGNCYGYDKIDKILPSEFIDAFKNGQTTIAFRLRFENAKQQNLLDAKATTLRTAVGYETAEFSQSAIRVELVDVANFFGHRFNAGISDYNRPSYSLIQDPPGAGVTEAKFMYHGFTNNVITLGRQYINLDNQRFVGMNNFRQYPQSFDAFSFQSNMIDTITLYYSYLTYVNTNFSNGRSVDARRSLSTNLFHGDWSGYRYGKIAAYLYFNKDKTVTTNSNTTFGVRLSNPPEFAEADQYGYWLEVARQQAHFDNPVSYVAYYFHGNLAKTIGMFTGTVGVERFGGNATLPNRAFITPLGSVDDFNGIAEVFNVIPSQGLKDYYAKIEIASAGRDIKLGIIYHYFRLDKSTGSTRAGQEWDFVGELGLSENIVFSVAYANYQPKNNIAPKTRRFWVMLNANLL